MSFWLDMDSTMIHSHCGDTSSDAIPHTIPFIISKDNKLGTAFDVDGQWRHDVNHTHWVIIDLLMPRYITNIRGVMNGTTNIQDVKFYITSDLTAWGDAVLEVTNWQSYTKDDDDPWEYQMNIPKVGRYVKVEVVTTTDANNYLRWG